LEDDVSVTVVAYLKAVFQNFYREQRIPTESPLSAAGFLDEI
jgi:hypothetical protein